MWPWHWKVCPCQLSACINASHLKTVTLYYIRLCNMLYSSWITGINAPMFWSNLVDTLQVLAKCNCPSPLKITPPPLPSSNDFWLVPECCTRIPSCNCCHILVFLPIYFNSSAFVVVFQTLEDLITLESLLMEDEGEQQCCDGKLRDGDSDLFGSLLHVADHCLYKIVRWARNLPDFAAISVSALSVLD